MKKTATSIVSVLFLTLSFASTAYADNSANANAGASSSSGAVVNDSSTTSAGAIAVGGDTALSVQTGGTNITFEGGEATVIPPPAAPVPSVSGSVPQLFSAPTSTTNENGIALTLYYEEKCPSDAVRGYDLTPRTYEGKSGNTQIVFSPHLNYVMETKNSHSKVEDVERVKLSFGKSGFYKCLGIITVSAIDKKAGETPFSVITADAKSFPIHHMKGYPVIAILSPHAAISATKGVDNNGRGFGLGGGLSKFFDPVLGTLGVSVATNSGVTYPETKIGGTFLLLAQVSQNDPDGVFIDLGNKKPEPVAEIKALPVPMTEVQASLN